MFVVSSLVSIVMHCATMGVFYLNKNFSLEGLLRGEGKSIFKHLYLNEYAEVDSKSSYI